MKSTLKMAFAAAVVVVAGSACGSAAVASPSPVVSAAAVAPSAVAPSSSAAVVASSSTAVASSSEAATPSSEPGSSQQVTRLTVAGTDVNGPALQLTVDLPSDWQSFTWGAQRGTSSPPSGMAFVVSAVDNTFSDPCAHREQSPKVGPTVEDLAKALGKIPNTTATDPIQTTIAAHAATYVEIAIPASLPCVPSEFYLWQDSPNGDWWVQGLNETARVWIFEVGGKRVTFLAHSYPGSGADAKSVFQKILDTVVFDGGS